MVGIGETHLYEGLVVAEEVADVESVLALSQADAHDLVPLLKEQAQGVGEPDLASDPGLGASDGVEYDGLKDVAAGGGEVAGGLARGGLLDEAADGEHAVRRSFGSDDAVSADSLVRDCFDGDGGGGAMLGVGGHHAGEDGLSGLRDEDRVSEGDDDWLTAGEGLAAVRPRPRRDCAAAEHVGADPTEGGRPGGTGCPINCIATRSVAAAVAVEVVLDGALALAGDEEHLSEPALGELFHHVLDGGLAADRQHFLGLRPGGRHEPSASPCGGDDGFGDRRM